MREEEKKRTSQNGNWQTFFKKRWVFPAIYLLSAAIILTAVLYFQGSGENLANKDEFETNPSSQSLAGKGQEAVEVSKAVETFEMPVTSPEQVEIKKQFYDLKASKEEQEAALVVYNNSYFPSTGLDIAMKSGETFDVVASLSGTVTRVENDSILGNIVEITHDKGLVTVYQALENVQVAQGDAVKQGQVIAKAGKSAYNADAGVHVHFEIRRDGQPVNPIAFFDKPMTSLPSAEEEQQAAGEAVESSTTPATTNPTDASKDSTKTESTTPATDSTNTESTTPATDSTKSNSTTPSADKSQDSTNTETTEDATKSDSAPSTDVNENADDKPVESTKANQQ